MSEPVTIRYDQGSLVVHWPETVAFHQEGLPSPWVWDDRVGAWRAPALAYRPFILHLMDRGIPFVDEARRYPDLDVVHRAVKTPHPHQAEALEAWWNAGRRGVVVLPTGAGKSYLAEMAIARVRRPTLVVVPTIDLLNQWFDGLCSAFGMEIGIIGGGHHVVQPITVTTYDSAYLHLDRYGDRFGFLVFDECHHLPAASHAQAAEWAIAPFRLGLTATPERPDGSHVLLETLIGPVVYQLDVKALTGRYLAEYEVVRVDVDMNEEELSRYRAARRVYRAFLDYHRIRMGSQDGFRRFLFLASRTPEGRRAFAAYRTSRRIALAPVSKLDQLERILVRHRRDRVIIFTHENEMVYQVARRLLIPAITHRTEPRERRDILEAFRTGTYRAVVTSRVLNEGVDVPAANVGVVLSGSGSVREHVQRLGRLLRRDGDKQAVLYEVVTRDSLEERVSERRREHRAYH